MTGILRNIWMILLGLVCLLASYAKIAAAEDAMLCRNVAAWSHADNAAPRKMIGGEAQKAIGQVDYFHHASASWQVDSHSKCNSCWQKTSAGVWKSRHLRGVWL